MEAPKGQKNSDGGATPGRTGYPNKSPKGATEICRTFGTPKLLSPYYGGFTPA